MEYMLSLCLYLKICNCFSSYWCVCICVLVLHLSGCTEVIKFNSVNGKLKKGSYKVDCKAGGFDAEQKYMSFCILDLRWWLTLCSEKWFWRLIYQIFRRVILPYFNLSVKILPITDTWFHEFTYGEIYSSWYRKRFRGCIIYDVWWTSLDSQVQVYSI